MTSTKTLEIEKIVAINEEVEASYNFIIEGIRALNNQNSAISNNHVSLQLLSSGFERLVKILLILKEKHISNQYPNIEGNRNYFSRFDNGHGIKKMLNNLILYAESIESMNKYDFIIEDLDFLKNDKYFNEFIEIITDFSKYQRYYYIDIIVKKERPKNNSFEKFKTLINSYSETINKTKLTYDEEEKYVLNAIIITIERGIRAISRFFTHGLGKEGKKNWGDFDRFIIMRDENLGSLKYLIPKINFQTDYLPWKNYDLKYLMIKIFSKSINVYSSDCKNWPFLVKKVKVINYKSGRFHFVKIGNCIFALTGKTVGKYKIPTYFASKQLIPRKHTTELIKISQKL